MRISAVVVAAGRGERFGSQKQFLSFGEHSVAATSVAAARSVASEVILVVPEGYQGSGEGADRTVCGGATRSASVRNGLASVASADIVVIHDAARPLASAQLFRAVVAAIVDDVIGAVPALDVTDTVKLVERGSLTRVVGTVDRSALVTVQTPQAFRFQDLLNAHNESCDATDDAALLEARGALIVTVAGEASNIKITTPEDWARVRELAGSAS